MENNLPKQTILVVDDIPENIDVLAGILREDYKLKVTINGETALSIARTQRPLDLILLDIEMPGMDGYEVCRKLKQDESTKNIPVIFVTAKSESEAEAKGFKIGGVDYITKPVNPSIVRERVKTHLALYNQNRVLEEKVREQTAQIRETFEYNEKVRNDFITSISHELRTPMNAILGGLDLAHKHIPGRLKAPMDIIRNGATHMMNLVNDILTHTEIQSDRIAVQSDHINSHSLLRSMSESYRYLCEDKSLQLAWIVDNSLPKWICTDEKRLVIILSKLLDNAIKFTEQGQITLNITCDQSTSPWQFICIVQDTGIGIAQEKQTHIFDSFVQSDGGFQRRYGGLGIGLSICKKLTEAMGGELSLESIEGQGSSFTVILPIALGVEPIIEKNTNFASFDLPILVVEDNRVNQKVMIKLLEKIGYKSLIANHGKEALEILEKEAVSVILMDLQMPVMDGLTCTAKIRGREDKLKNIPIIAVTANLMDADKERCIESGMNDFIKKPIKPHILRNSLLRFIESKNEES